MAKAGGEILRKRSIFAVCGAVILILMTVSITPAVHAQPVVSMQRELENKMNNMDLEKAKRDMNLTLVFQKGIRDLSCGVWIEQQAITDDVIPEKILIDLNPFSKVKKLELKNADFEQPY